MKFIYSLMLVMGFAFGISAQGTDYNKPESPKNPRFVDDQATGNVTYIWDAVTKDIDGNEIPPSDIRYLLYDTQSGEIIAVINTNSITRREYSPGQIISRQYSLRSQIISAEKSSALLHDKTTVLGKEFTLPCCESFNSINDMCGLWVGNNKQANSGQIVTVYDNSMISGVTSQDGDSGFIGFTSRAYPLFSR